MNWLNGQIINWEAPECFVTRFKNKDIAFLYSSMSDQASGGSSYLAVTPLYVVEGSDWEEFSTFITATTNASLPDWIGYLGYGMREHGQRTDAATVRFPDFRFIRYAHLFHFNHTQKTLTYYRREVVAALQIPDPALIDNTATTVSKIASNFNRAAYETAVKKTITEIHAGNFYQANITRKFFGEFASVPDSLALFLALTKASPAAYSAYIRHGGSAILSASPESFLEIDAAGNVTTRPIKGSARRSEDLETDKKIREALRASEKNQAENLMIVDLMRNDLAQVCEAASVHVPAQSALHSYATIHHLISTIHGKKSADASLVEVLRACFPPGSMTGAPKIAAMEWCSKMEPMERGVYSGALGWISGERCDLSVVIRTLLIEGARFEFQVGGGIVADSTPEDEWRETLAKARGICAALGVREEVLAAL
jgi:para-aminobenzoate synthetase component 1